jgi:hypothetical protein
MTKKKYILKPGKHQFAPGSAATHHNDNLSDTEAEWYIEKYPHIKNLFEITPTDNPAIKSSESESVGSQQQLAQSKSKSVQSPNKPVQSNPNEDLSTTN